MRIKRLAQVIAVIGIAGPALAQQTGTDSGVARMEKVIITGSSIKKVESEGALPIQIITKEDIDRAGITSAEQLMETISANVSGAYNLASQQGFVTSFAAGRQFNNGQSAANLRGLGAGSTLILTMSEFGRAVRQNGNRGTDHGHATSFFALGGAVNGGKVLGKWPGLAPEQLFEARDLALTTDFRDVFAEVSQKHLGTRSTTKVFPDYRLDPDNYRGLVKI